MSVIFLRIIHLPGRSGIHPILPQVVWEGQAKMPRLPSRYVSTPPRLPESREGDFQVGNISVLGDGNILLNHFKPLQNFLWWIFY